MADLFSLVVAAAGWFYALYSTPPEVRGEEAGRLNRKRQRLRRAGGLVMMALAICFFAGFWTVDWEPPTKAFYWIWVAVAGLRGCCAKVEFTSASTNKPPACRPKRCPGRAGM